MSTRCSEGNSRLRQSIAGNAPHDRRRGLRVSAQGGSEFSGRLAGRTCIPFSFRSGTRGAAGAVDGARALARPQGPSAREALHTSERPLFPPKTRIPPPISCWRQHNRIQYACARERYQGGRTARFRARQRSEGRCASLASQREVRNDDAHGHGPWSHVGGTCLR
jgi:hypothetical protein